MDQANEISGLVQTFVGMMLLFIPVLFGAVEFIKQKTNLQGGAVEALSAGLFVVFGFLVVLSYYFPEWGGQVAAAVMFLVMCALAPSGYYKFINSRTDKRL